MQQGKFVFGNRQLKDIFNLILRLLDHTETKDNSLSFGKLISHIKTNTHLYN